MDSLKRNIEKYMPYNEQEENDKKIILDYMEKYDNLLTRENEIAHFTASAWTINKECTKVLMIYHKIYNSWAWTGGHADGDTKLLKTAVRELKEETGIKNVNSLKDDIYSLEIICVNGHIKREKYVSSHLHFNLTYLLEADEKEELMMKEDENSGVKWINIADINEYSTEPWMKEKIYRKLVQQIKR